MTTLFGLLAIGLAWYAVTLQICIDGLKDENRRLMDCIIEIEKETGEME